MILVTGSSGLLGSHLCARHPKDTLGFSRAEFDVTNDDLILSVLNRIRPDVVINCAGVTRPDKVDPYTVYLVNTVAPRSLAYWCDELKIRFIQISTNCVFSGDWKRPYSEYDEPDAKDLYGRTKAQGEVYDYEYRDVLTVRTSFVGWPDPSGRGLISWLWKRTKNKPVPGYANVLWNGLTVTALVDHLIELAYSRMTGVVHLTGETISKYNLLRIVNDLYDWGHTIEPVEAEVSSKLLKNIRALPYPVKEQSFAEACAEMRHQGMREYV